MKEDLAIKRIREVRHKISKEFDHNPQKLIEYYIEFQKNYQNCIIDKVQFLENSKEETKKS